MLESLEYYIVRLVMLFVISIDAVTIVLFQVLGAFANIEFDVGSEHNSAVDVSVYIQY